MKIQREKLLQALNFIKPGITGNDLIKEFDFFAFLKDKICTYNAELIFSYFISDMNLTVTVKADELYALLNRIKKEEIELLIHENELQIISGKIRAGIKCTDPINIPFEKIEEKNWHVLPENFSTALEFVVPACGKNITYPILMSVCISENKMVASDGYRIINYHIKTGINNALLPANNAKEIAKLQPTHFYQKSDQWIHFRNSENGIISSRVYAEKYPDTSHFIANMQGKIISFPKTILEAIQRASIFSKREKFIEEMILITFTENRISIEGTGDYGWIKEELNIKYSDTPFKFYINPNLLYDIFPDIIEYKINDTAIKFKGENWEYLIMLCK